MSLPESFASVFCVAFLGIVAPLSAQHHKEKSEVLPANPKVVRIIVKDTVLLNNWLKQNASVSAKRVKLPDAPVYELSNLSAAQSARIKTLPWICYSEHGGRKAVAEAHVPGMDISVNGVSAVHSTYPLITGEGLGVSIKENAFDKNDPDLVRRVINPESITPTYDPHATAMATIICGAGNSNPRNKGAAWMAMAGSSDFSNLFPDDFEKLQQENISVQNHSYGVGEIENFYGLESQAYDLQSYSNPSLVHVFSSGNFGEQTPQSGSYKNISGFANLTGQFKNSKNGIVVGSTDMNLMIDLLSSRGPAGDGRIKPELVAYGADGSSGAAALVSGMVLMIQDAFKRTYHELPSSSLVKAAFINSANDAGSPYVDYIYGFGHADALGAVEAVLTNRFFEGTVTDKSESMASIEVPEAVNELKVTLAWIDPPGQPVGDANAKRSLVNDLDLELRHASGAIFRPWVLSSFAHIDSLTKVARRATDTVNNVEQISVSFPEAGRYDILVKGSHLETQTQNFSVVYEYSSGLRWIYPLSQDVPISGSEVRLRWDGLLSTPATIEYRRTNSTEWNSIAQVEALVSSIKWETPQVSDIFELRIRTASDTITSDSFVVSRELDLKAAYNCDDGTLLYWNGGDGNSFQIFELNETHMQPAITTSDTTFEIAADLSENALFSVSHTVRGRPGVRSNGFNVTSSNAPCYFNSFLASRMVSDYVELQVELSSVLGIRSLTLERSTGTGFESVSTIESPGSTNLVFEDPDPMIGRNEYRVLIERTNGGLVRSSVEVVWYVREDNVIVYPNPLSNEKMLTLIATSEVIEARLFDLRGNLVRKSEENGEIKNFDMSGLPPGIFVLQLVGDKTITVRKIIVNN